MWGWGVCVGVCVCVGLHCVWCVIMVMCNNARSALVISVGANAVAVFLVNTSLWEQKLICYLNTVLDNIDACRYKKVPILHFPFSSLTIGELQSRQQSN